VVWRLSTVDYRHDIAYTGEIDEQQLPLSASWLWHELRDRRDAAWRFCRV